MAEKRIKVAVFGNNLNVGYNMAKLFRQYGLETKVFLYNYRYGQEKYSWWEKDVDASLIHLCDFDVAFPNLAVIRQPLRNASHISELYAEVENYDVLLMMEDGPALFSELHGPKKVFFSLGFDLQVIPFYIERLYPFRLVLPHYFDRSESRRKIYFENKRYYEIYQQRQRIGLNQCSQVICSPHQYGLLEKLKIEPSKITCLPLVLKESIYQHIDEQVVRQLEQKYLSYDLLFFHPTRQLYLHLDNNMYMKDNEKLFKAFARFVSRTKLKAKLIAIDKGREQDLQNTKQLIRRLGIESHVEWLSELPNIQLRAYYALDKVVVCDQFSPNLAILGNIGREASYYGRLLITAYRDWNKKLYGEDIPPHIFPAMTEQQIFAAMMKIEQLGVGRRRELHSESLGWYERNLNSKITVPKYVDVIRRSLDDDESGNGAQFVSSF